MFGPLGVPELLFILVLALLIFGPRRLPEIGRTVGRAMGEFRRASTELQRTLNTEIALDEEDAETAPPSSRKPAADSESAPRIEARPAPGSVPAGVDPAAAPQPASADEPPPGPEAEAEAAPAPEPAVDAEP